MPYLPRTLSILLLNLCIKYKQHAWYGISKVLAISNSYTRNSIQGFYKPRHILVRATIFTVELGKFWGDVTIWVRQTDNFQGVRWRKFQIGHVG